ncbi:hypothetical protein PLICRDRAFT_35410 [Plicaturopsis crispa FD-325 SS-3]|nr:hypothetical protein PLICRDRAFT_35410 [Plicaturopsis crispa FD-325 SS-3]
MEDTIRKRHEQTLDEEELFLRLRQQVHDKEEAEILAAQNLERRHSIANDEIGLSTYPPVELGYPTY